MKKAIAFILALTILMSVAVFSSSAASRVTGIRQVAASTTSIDVSWDEYFGATRYKVEYSDSPNGYYMVDTEYASTSLKESIYSVSPGHTYYVKVTPYVNGSFVGSAVSEPTAVATAPNQVTEVKQKSATSNSFTISWTGSLGATKYGVYSYANSTEKLIGTTTKTSYTVNKVSNKNSVPFDVRVKAIRNINGFDAVYSYSSLSGYNINLKPRKSTLKLSSIYDSIGVIYFDSESVPFRKGYEINVYKANKKKVYTSGTGWRYTGFKKGQFYKAKTRSWTQIGGSTKHLNGPWSKFVYFTLGCSKVNASSGTNSISASWAKVKGGKVKYDIYVSKSYKTGLKKFKKNVKGTSIRVTKYGKSRLSRRTSYYVYIVPKLKVGKKYVKSPVMSYVSTYTR